MLRTSRGRLPRWAEWSGVLWLILIGAWLPVTLIELMTSKPPLSAVPGTGVLLGAIAVLASIGWGMVLGVLRRWRWILASAPAGTTVLLFWYVVAMLAANVNEPQVDNEAGAGVAVLAIPVLALVALLLALGGGFGAACNATGVLRRPAKSVAA